MNLKEFKKNPDCSITIGWLHAYTTESCANNIAKSFNNAGGYIKFNVYKMVIPRGTRYILGIGNEICAKRFKFNPEE